MKLVLIMTLGLLFNSTALRAQTSPSASTSAAPVSNLNLPSLLGGLSQDLAFFGNDIKTNTKFQINSIMGTQSFDWKNGQWLTGIAIPFLNIGSYDYFAFELDHDMSLSNSKMIPMLANGVRLNELTRPAATYILNKVPLLNNNQPLVATLAKALSVGITTGHDFNLKDKQGVMFNRVAIHMGFTYTFGPVSSPTTNP